MSRLSGMVSTIFSKRGDELLEQEERANFIFYKIVEGFVVEGNSYYKIQCINKMAVFTVRIEDLVFDSDILWGLHPFQSSYIGIEYASFFHEKKTSSCTSESHFGMSEYMVCRYGNYELRFQDRRGQLNFVHKPSSRPFLLDPREIVFSKELIEEFDAAQAFYIGLLAGLRINQASRFKKNKELLRAEYPHLRVIK